MAKISTDVYFLCVGYTTVEMYKRHHKKTVDWLLLNIIKKFKML